MRRIGLSLLSVGILVGCSHSSSPTAPSTPTMLEWSQGSTETVKSYDYGPLTLGPGQDSTVTFTLTNTGGQSSGTDTDSLSGTGSSAYFITADGCTGGTLGPNKTCTVTVEFAPTSTGTFDATLTAFAEHGRASLDLTGKGVGVDLVMLSPAVYDSTNTTGDKAGEKNYSYATGETLAPGDTSKAVEFTIKNQGTASSEPLTIGHVSEFDISNDTCKGTALAPGGSCTFDGAEIMEAGCVVGVSYGVGSDFNASVHTGFYVLLMLYATCGSG